MRDPKDSLARGIKAATDRFHYAFHDGSAGNTGFEGPRIGIDQWRRDRPLDSSAHGIMGRAPLRGRGRCRIDHVFPEGGDIGHGQGNTMSVSCGRPLGPRATPDGHLGPPEPVPGHTSPGSRGGPLGPRTTHLGYLGSVPGLDHTNRGDGEKFGEAGTASCPRLPRHSFRRGWALWLTNHTHVLGGVGWAPGHWPQYVDPKTLDRGSIQLPGC